MSDDAFREALARIHEAARTKADSLDLGGLGLANLPPEIGRLAELQSLDLSHNQIAALPAAIGQLANLRMLNLWENRLVELPAQIGKLTNLIFLYLLDNRLVVLPAELGQLANLDSLYLCNNLLTGLPGELGQLANLRIIDLRGGNRLTALPAELGKLSNLQQLSLGGNRLTGLPAELGKLSNLHTLDLQFNKITALPVELCQLVNLKKLNLEGNRIAMLPDWFASLVELKELFLQGNPGLNLPSELLGPTSMDVALKTAKPCRPNEIIEYCLRTQRNGRALNEAKLIMVGKGAVGKSSLVEKLVHDTFAPGKAKTEGISIEQWPLEIGGEQVRLNIWDFGGQEIMHATHQFFLTERSLYLLVLNGREGNEDLEAEYWLKLIASFGGDSPVIIVLNKVKEHAFDLNRSALTKKYPNIRCFVRTDCSDETGIEDLRTAISAETNTLDELRVKFPGEWFSVKDELAFTKENYLGFEEYRKLCREHDITVAKQQEMLARFLNQLGVVLNYRDDPRLKDTHVLNPHWVTNGIYKILNSPKLEENQGEIKLSDVSQIVPETDYPVSMCRFIFDLMKKFDLCFTFPDDDTHYLIPELLPKNEPEITNDFILEECLNFQYRYPVLPEGLLPRFITRTHHLSIGEKRWRSGVILQFENCRALIKADAADRRITISIVGDDAESRRRLLAVVRADFERIHRDIKNLKPREMVPLPGVPEQMISYTDLLVMEKEGPKRYPVVVDGKVTYHDVAALLNGVDLPRRKDSGKETTGINVFFSYAHKDELYRIELETHLKLLQRQNVISGWSDRELGAGEEWRKEIAAQLENAGIILLLISADFLASDFCYEVEMKRAMERHKGGEARVIPVIIRDCHWHKAPFGELQALPADGKPVNLWDDKDSSWRNVTEGIERAAESLSQKEAERA